MTDQEIFDKVYLHLLKQNKLSECSTESFSGCAYRGPDNIKCAAGILIEDSEYQEWMEGNGFQTLIECAKCPTSLQRFRSHLDLILKLQEIHDEISVQSWKNKLEQLAGDYGLQIPSIG